MVKPSKSTAKHPEVDDAEPSGDELLKAVKNPAIICRVFCTFGKAYFLILAL